MRTKTMTNQDKVVKLTHQYKKFHKRHKRYIKRSLTTELNVAEGAFRAAKTTSNIIAFALNLEMTPDKLHIASAVTQSTAKLIFGDGDGLGLEHIYSGRCKWGKYKDKEALIIKTFSNQLKYILFVGGYEKTSHYPIRGLSIGMWIATEIDLHNKAFIDEMNKRLIKSAHRRKFFDFNPTYPTHWIYKEFIDLYIMRDEGREYKRINYAKFTLFYNLSLSKRQIHDVLDTYDTEGDQFKRDILGSRVESSGRCFPSFNRDVSLISTPIVKMVSFYIGIDWGYSSSKTVFVLGGINGNRVTVLKTQGISGDRSSSDNLEAAYKFIIDSQELIFELTGKKVYPKVYPDAADKGMYIDLKKKYFNTFMKGKHSIKTRIRVLNKIIRDKQLYIVEGASNLELCEAIESAIYNPKVGKEEERLDDGSTPIDYNDAFEYMLTDVITKIEQSIR